MLRILLLFWTLIAVSKTQNNTTFLNASDYSDQSPLNWLHHLKTTAATVNKMDEPKTTSYLFYNSSYEFNNSEKKFYQSYDHSQKMQLNNYSFLNEINNLISNGNVSLGNKIVNKNYYIGSITQPQNYSSSHEKLPNEILLHYSLVSNKKEPVVNNKSVYYIHDRIKLQENSNENSSQMNLMAVNDDKRNTIQNSLEQNFSPSTYIEPKYSVGTSIENNFSPATNIEPKFSVETNIEQNFSPAMNNEPKFSAETSKEQNFIPVVSIEPTYSVGTSIVQNFSPAANIEPKYSVQTSTEPNLSPATNIESKYSVGTSIVQNFSPAANIEPKYSVQTSIEPNFSPATYTELKYSVGLNTEQNLSTETSTEESLRVYIVTQIQKKSKPSSGKKAFSMWGIEQNYPAPEFGQYPVVNQDAENHLSTTVCSCPQIGSSHIHNADNTVTKCPNNLTTCYDVPVVETFSSIQNNSGPMEENTAESRNVIQTSSTLYENTSDNLFSRNHISDNTLFSSNMSENTLFPLNSSDVSEHSLFPLSSSEITENTLFLSSTNVSKNQFSSSLATGLTEVPNFNRTGIENICTQIITVLCPENVTKESSTTELEMTPLTSILTIPHSITEEVNTVSLSPQDVESTVFPTVQETPLTECFPVTKNSSKIKPSVFPVNISILTVNTVSDKFKVKLSESLSTPLSNGPLNGNIAECKNCSVQAKEFCPNHNCSVERKVTRTAVVQAKNDLVSSIKTDSFCSNQTQHDVKQFVTGRPPDNNGNCTVNAFTLNLHLNVIEGLSTYNYSVPKNDWLNLLSTDKQMHPENFTSLPMNESEKMQPTRSGQVLKGVHV